MHLLTALFSAIFVIAVIIGIATFLHEKKLRRQHGVDREQFITYFSGFGIPGSISAAVYDAYKKKAYSKSFKPSPEMRLLETFNQEREDIDDEALFILKDLKIPVPTEVDLKTWPGGDVNTIGDLVKWVSWVSTFPRET